MHKQVTPEETRPGILVPVNSSASAFNSIEYAMKIAKALNTTIHLLYITDLNDLPESSNTIVINRMLDRFELDAAMCVESLTEMIEECGIKVPTAESRVGNVELLIQNRIEFLAPGMIVIGRDSFRKQAVDILIDQATCPLLFVPKNADASLPSSFALRLNKDLIPPKSVYPLLKIIQQTTQRLTILSDHKKSNLDPFQNQVIEPNFKLSITYLLHENTMDAKVMRTFIRSAGFDLLCVVRDRRPFFKRIFTKDPAARIVHTVEIPVMLVK
jgi:nucleotide-binding universal stress UspA family protein